MKSQPAARPDVVFRSRTAVDVSAAFEWYELQRMGLGERFLQSVGQAIDAVREIPESGPMVLAQVRRRIVPRFPYGIFYVVQDGVVVVLAVVHSRRNPESWPGHGGDSL